jgi:integrase
LTSSKRRSFLFRKVVQIASVRQKNGRWYYSFNIKQANGKWKKVERGGFDTKREAKEKGEALEAEYKTTKELWQPKEMTYEALAHEWLEYAPNEYKFTTLNGYLKELTTNIFPMIGNYYISALTPKLCQEVISNGIGKHYTRNRLSRLKGALNQPLKYAVNQGYLKYNPATTVRLPLHRSKMAEKIRTPREQKSIPREEMKAIFNRFPKGHPCYLPLLLGYRCGLRLGEAYGLFVEDVDLDNMKLSINHQIQYDSKSNMYITAPKYCRAGEGRIIDLDIDTANELREQIEMITNIMKPIKYFMREDGLINQSGEGREIHFLNVRLDGSYIQPRTMLNVSRVIHGKTGSFDYVDELWDFHSLRHTHASELIAHGVAPVEVQRRLGHKKLESVYRYYVHSTQETEEKTNQILEQMFVEN